jgi:hypothetical protein
LELGNGIGLADLGGWKCLVRFLVGQYELNSACMFTEVGVEVAVHWVTSPTFRCRDQVSPHSLQSNGNSPEFGWHRTACRLNNCMQAFMREEEVNCGKRGLLFDRETDSQRGRSEFGNCKLLDIFTFRYIYLCFISK